MRFSVVLRPHAHAGRVADASACCRLVAHAGARYIPVECTSLARPSAYGQHTSEYGWYGDTYLSRIAEITHTSAYVSIRHSIRQHTSAYDTYLSRIAEITTHLWCFIAVSTCIRQQYVSNTAAYGSVEAALLQRLVNLAYASILQHTAAYVSVEAALLQRLVNLAYASIRQHTSAYGSIRQHSATYVSVETALVSSSAPAQRAHS